MKVRGFGQQDRIKIALSRQDIERLWKMAQMLPGTSPDEIVEVRLVPGNDYEWEIPEPSPDIAGRHWFSDLDRIGATSGIDSLLVSLQVTPNRT